MRVLGLSGSLRAASVNTALLHAARAVAPDGLALHVFGGLGDLPLFNPDLEEQVIPPVAAFRRTLRASDAVLIACPEYAHGVPGAFKNALDWVVGSGELDGKPTLVLSASARSVHAPAALIEILRTMGAQLVGDGPQVIDLPRRPLSPAEPGALPGVPGALSGALERLAREVGNPPDPPPVP